MIHTCADFVRSVPGRWAARAMFRLGPDEIASDETWQLFTMTCHEAVEIFPTEGDDDPAYAWVEHLRRGMRYWSSGERSLALAVLHAIDYDWLADELAMAWDQHNEKPVCRAFSILSHASGEWAQAVGACFARVDR